MARSTSRGALGGLVLTALVGAAWILPQPSAALQPVASCAWTPVSEIEHTVGLTVRKPRYSEFQGFGYRNARCSWAYRTKPSIPNVSYVNGLTIEYSELHDSLSEVDPATPGVDPTTGARTTVVQGLGTCPRDQPTCPYTALLSLTKGKHGRRAFISNAVLGVEDGSREFAISVTSYFGPLPVKDEVANLKQLARTIMPHYFGG